MDRTCTREQDVNRLSLSFYRPYTINSLGISRVRELRKGCLIRPRAPLQLPYGVAHQELEQRLASAPNDRGRRHLQ
jgi:hypothetical protein